MTARSNVPSLFLLMAVMAGSTAATQTPPAAQGQVRSRTPVVVEPKRQEVEIAAQSGEVVMMAGGAATFDMITGPLDPSHAMVKDAPYSAEATNEIIQTLADGNRIVRKSSSAVYRDGAGRTRREQSLAAVGPVAASARMQPVVINDPVAGFNYVLDPEKKTARRMRALPRIVAPGPGGDEQGRAGEGCGDGRRASGGAHRRRDGGGRRGGRVGEGRRGRADGRGGRPRRRVRARHRVSGIGGVERDYEDGIAWHAID